MGVLRAKVNGNWVDVFGGGQGGISEADADLRYVNITGDTMTGPLTVNGLTAFNNNVSVAAGKYLEASGPIYTYAAVTNDYQVATKGYVDVQFVNAAGDLMTGRLVLPGGDLLYPNASGGYISWAEGTPASNTRQAYVGFDGTNREFKIINESTANYMRLQSTTGVYFVAAGVEIARCFNGALLVGRTSASGHGDPGWIMNASTNYYVSDALNGGINITHIGAADANASAYTAFRRTTSGSQIGSITQVATTGVAYNQTSDYRLKTVVGPVRDAADRVRRLHPVDFTWNETGARQDGFLAHEVAAVVPDAVCGEKDAVDDDGAIAPQQLDQSRLIPLLTAALQQALGRIDLLEARITTLEAAA